MYKIVEVSGDFFVINERTREIEAVCGNLKCAQDIMEELAEGFAIMCGVMS